MELWYSEFHTGNVKLSVRINRQLFSGESEFQRIDVFESEEFGRFVALDGEIVFSDKDEFIYDEMVTHVPMTVHPNVKNVLIIGGGDGGVARELIHYPQIESIDVVESDKMFVDVCAEMFPDIAQGLKDERVNIYYEDGLRFLRNKKARYDLIINDSTDPLGHTEGLFTKEFYGSCYKALRDDGIMVYQHGSPFYDEDEVECRKMHRKVFRSFPVSKIICIIDYHMEQKEVSRNSFLTLLHPYLLNMIICFFLFPLQKSFNFPHNILENFQVFQCICCFQ